MSDKALEVLKAVLDWLSKVMPTALGFMALGYKWGASKVLSLKMKNVALSLENEKLKNEKSVRDQFDGLSDSEVIDRVLSSPDPSKPIAGPRKDS